VTAERLAAALSQQVQVLQAKVDQLEAAAEQASDAAALKRWLKD
jgi:outer membrane murein-binding lipoprotein Lpp